VYTCIGLIGFIGLIGIAIVRRAIMGA